MSLQKLLDEKNISMYRLSKMSGVPKTTIIDICSGKSNLENCTAKTVYRIALVLDCTVENLLMMSTVPYFDGKRVNDDKGNTKCTTGAGGNKRMLKDYGIDFNVSKTLETDFFALIDGVNNGDSYIDCLRDELLSSVHASYSAGLLSAQQAEFIEQNFIFSNRGIQNG